MTDTVVETIYGGVRGRRESGDVLAFLGVPYGASTAGAARFRPPTPPVAWTEVRDATKFGPACPQVDHSRAYEQLPPSQLPRIQPSSSAAFDEDCLRLNIWTSDISARRPVMVWFHGGAWTFGVPGGDEPHLATTNGDRLAATGEVVVVTVTHRIGVFGFCYLAELLGEEFAASGNVGILDLAASLEWVSENIAAFGGDPDNVTVFGYSGGSSKVASLLALERARGRFHRAGCISGHLHCCYSADEATSLAVELLGELGLGHNDAVKLHEVPTDAIVSATTTMVRKAGGLMRGGLKALKFAPVVDGTIYDRNPLELISAGVSADVPLLTTVTREEFTLQLIGDERFGAFTDAEIHDRVRSFLEGDADTAIQGYRSARPAASSTEILTEIIGDHLIRLPTYDILERHRERATAPSFFGVCTWQSPALGGALRAYHGVDVPFIFDTMDREAKLAPVTDLAEALRDRLRDSWIAFARSGDPNHPGIPNWPVFGSEDAWAMIFGGEWRVESDPLRVARHHNRMLTPSPPIGATASI